MFRITKQRTNEGWDILGVNCWKDEKGVVKVTVDEHKSIWKNHMENLMNVENILGDCVDHAKVEGLVSMI